MKIAILGTRGIPNSYGGFEQFAEFLSYGLLKMGNEVYVYNPHKHPHKEKQWKGINIIHKFDPEYKIGTAGQFIYDFNCIRDSRSRGFDIILQLGYTSNSIWSFILPDNSLIVTNMDGLEWKRSKYGFLVKHFLRFAEKLAVISSNKLIADSIGIQEYLKKKYNVQSVYIPYGAVIPKSYDESMLSIFNLKKSKYDLVICRLEPENNVQTIIEGFVKSKTIRKLFIVGSINTNYGKRLSDHYASETIQFAGAIYNINILNNLRHFCNLYLHGHSVGGTNPSLLEAMACGAVICAHDNPFNRDTMGLNGLYFNDSETLSLIIEKGMNGFNKDKAVESNLERISQHFNWQKITRDYQGLFKSLIEEKN